MKEFLKCSVFLSSFIINLSAFYHECAEADRGQSQKLTIFKSEKKNISNCNILGKSFSKYLSNLKNYGKSQLL